MNEYLAAGVRLVWIVDPEAKQVLVYRADGGRAILHESDRLSGDDVLPGLTVAVAEIFSLPTGTGSNGATA